jgi:signal peptidase II
MQLLRMRPVFVAGAVVALDQFTKWEVRQAFACEGAFREVVPGLLNLCYVRNTGAAWGMLAGWQVFLIAFSLAALALLVWQRRALLGTVPLQWLLLGLLTGGITGNLIDRVWLRYVVDFLDFHWGSSHFPAFNVADASLCVGVGLFLLMQLRQSRRRDAAVK